MDYVTILGLVTGALATISFLPQVIKVWKTKSTKDISLGMYLIFCTASFLWIVYGTLINSIPVMVTNIAILILALIILAFKLKYK
ncbi:MAG: SemiSWEET transporter [Candidatus Aenigmatarchaeota archaeon]